MNRSKDLRRLFRESLINERNRPKVNYVRQSSPLYSTNVTRIYFYEWSNINSCPRCFYNLPIFEEFLKSSGISMEMYQRQIIINNGTVYISCYSGTKLLCVCTTYGELLKGMGAYDAKHLLSSIEKPKLILETSNHIPQNDGTFFG